MDRPVDTGKITDHRRLSRKAIKSGGMTLDELEKIVQVAKAKGIPGTARPVVNTTVFTQRIKKIIIEGDQIEETP